MGFQRAFSTAATMAAGLGIGAAPASAGNLYGNFGSGSCTGSVALTLKEGWVYPSVDGRCTKSGIGRGVFIHVWRPGGIEPDWAYDYRDFVNNKATVTVPRLVVEPGAYKICGYIRKVNSNEDVASGCADHAFK